MSITLWRIPKSYSFLESLNKKRKKICLRDGSCESSMATEDYCMLGIFDCRNSEYVVIIIKVTPLSSISILFVRPALSVGSVFIIYANEH